jgi:hypothetical protein
MVFLGRAKIRVTVKPDGTAKMMNEARAQEPQPEDVQILQLILRAMREIRYGSVQIVIQDSKVVQIDRVEKLRLV